MNKGIVFRTGLTRTRLARAAGIVVGGLAMAFALTGLCIGAANAAGGASPQDRKDTVTVTDPAPPPPPWVRTDGTVDRSKLPAQMQLMDSKGNPVVDAQGRPVMVSTAVVGGPPQPGTIPGTTSTYVDPATGETRTAENIDLTGQ